MLDMKMTITELDKPVIAAPALDAPDTEKILVL